MLSDASSDLWSIAGLELSSRLLLGTALYPSLDLMEQSIKVSQSQMITLSLRRESNALKNTQNTFWDHIKNIQKERSIHLLPNTAGCHNVDEAITTAHMAREIFETSRIKLEVIHDDYTLHPDVTKLVEAAEILCKDGFTVFPYMTDDLSIARRLLDVGCDILMPLAAPIGSGKGILNPYTLTTLKNFVPKGTNLIVDAGIGKPSDATRALEMGYDGVLLNTAVAKSGNPVIMAKAFASAANAGRFGYLAGTIEERSSASASTPMVGRPFWHHNKK